MISIKFDDDQSDIIDLTASSGYYGSFNYPIPPPSPFADHPKQTSPIPIDDNETNGMMTWSTPTRQSTINPISSSSGTNNWRRRLSKLLKRTKSTKHKKDITHPYDFGKGETVSKDSRSTIKRVHWVDDHDDELIFNVCHRFIENLKIYVENIPKNQTDDYYLKQCQTSLDKLHSLIDCHEITKAFNQLLLYTQNHDKIQLNQQLNYIENLISHIIHSSSSA